MSLLIFTSSFANLVHGEFADGEQRAAEKVWGRRCIKQTEQEEAPARPPAAHVSSAEGMLVLLMDAFVQTTPAKSDKMLQLRRKLDLKREKCCSLPLLCEVETQTIHFIALSVFKECKVAQNEHFTLELLFLSVPLTPVFV